MTVFSLIISLSTFNWFLIKFVNFQNNTLLLCLETLMLITMLQIHQGIVMLVSSDSRKINFLLCGIKSVNYDINSALFREVQRFIISTNRFSIATV